MAEPIFSNGSSASELDGSQRWGDRPSTARRLLVSALGTFSEVGFHGTTTRDIAVMAEVSRAALYVYFPSKEDLLFEISRTAHSEVLNLLQSAGTVSADPREVIEHMTYGFVNWHAENVRLARVAQYELSALTREHFDQIQLIRRGCMRELRVCVNRGIEMNVFDVLDARLSSLALASLGIDVARWYRADGAWSTAQISAHYVYLGLRILGVSTGYSTRLDYGVLSV